MNSPKTANGAPHIDGRNGQAFKTIENLAWKSASYKTLFALMLIPPLVVNYYFGWSWVVYPLTFICLLLPAFGVFMITFNIVSDTRQGKKSRIEEFITFNDEKLQKKYTGQFIPIQVLYEGYFAGRLDFKTDVLEALEYRESYVTYRFTLWHVKFFILTFLPELLFHTRKQDLDQVRDHYDRGNDFYRGFLGERMVYTAGIMENVNNTLEQMQDNKMKGVCKKVQLKPTDRYLDIGCGWGTLVNFAAENYGPLSVGLTLAKNQANYAKQIADEKGQGDRAKFICADYRDFKDKNFDKITCLEMAEHVGIRLFGSFVSQVYDMLDDNGIFFLQIAGLRRAWQWEDFIWGLFMAKYIFPGADASCPLNFVVGHLEAAGFEIQSCETVGIHYSHTIRRWYLNWIKEENKAEMTNKYGSRLYRIWEVFLAWSTIIARQGNSTCYQIVAHKNLNHYTRNKFVFTSKENI